MFAQFEWLAKHAPQLKAVALNGKKAGAAQTRIEALGYRVLVLPSSSPAFTLAYEKKLEAWMVLREFVDAASSTGKRR